MNTPPKITAPMTASARTAAYTRQTGRDGLSPKQSRRWMRKANRAQIRAVITFNDERAEARLRGMTCAGGYVDEWSLMPESFHEAATRRVRTGDTP